LEKIAICPGKSSEQTFFQPKGPPHMENE
jgi:hypothetical protein